MAEIWLPSSGERLPVNRPTTPELSTEQRNALIEGPGMVTNPAELFLIDFDSLSKFRTHEKGFNGWGSNNYRMRHMKCSLGDAYRQTESYQRYEIIHPESAAMLMKLMEACNDRPDVFVWGKLLVEGHNKIRPLVDMNDRGVIENGVINPLFLTS